MVDTDNQFYKIKKQVSYFKSIINNTPGCIFWKNKEGIYLGCNHVFVEMAGLDKIEEVIGKTDEDLCWKHDAQLLQKHDKSVMKSGKSLSIEEEITLASGERRLYSVVKKPLLDDSNNIIGVLGTAIDITYRQIAQNELTEARKITSNYLQNIIESLPEYIYWKDQDLVYQGCNYRVANSLDLKSPRDIIGKTDHDFGWSQNRIAELHKIDNLVLSEGINSTVEDIIPILQGVRIMLTSKSPMKDKAGNIIGILGISFDISDRKQLEEELKISQQKAEVANEAKSDFIANMSHDIRTPITGMLGLIHRIKERHTQDPTTQRDTERLDKATWSLLRLLNEIIDIVDLESGEMNKAPETFSLWDLIEHNLQLQLPRTIDKGIDVRVDIDPGTPAVLFGPRVYLDRIVLNLLSNAIKFTEEGVVTLSMAATLEAENQLSLQIMIEDSGIGIPEDKFDLIFEHFARLLPSYRGTYEGSGLGLYTVKRYADVLGGTIDVSSEPGVGSRFTLTVPFVLGHPEDLPETQKGPSVESIQALVHSVRPAAQAPNSSPLHTLSVVRSVTDCNAVVLMVEDQAIVQLALKVQLAAHGIKQPLWAVDAKTALPMTNDQLSEVLARYLPEERAAPSAALLLATYLKIQ